MHPTVMADLAHERHTELLRTAALVRRARRQGPARRADAHQTSPKRVSRALARRLRQLVPARHHTPACCA